MTSRRAVLSAYATSWLMLALLAAPALAAPEIRNVNIRGLQIGATTTLTIDGTDLLPNPQIVMSLPIVAQNVQPNATASRVTIAVTLDKSVQPGMYNLWLGNANGISGKVVVAVDHLPQRVFAAAIDSLPIALHGTVASSAKLRTTFVGKKDQEILIEVEAIRLGGKLRPVLHLYDEPGRHLAWSMPSPVLRGDTRLTAKLPSTGKYTVELHDLQYAALAPNHFRLKIGMWQFADQVFPIAVQRGKKASLELIGNISPDKRIPLITSSLTNQLPIPWLDTLASSGLQPGVRVSSFPEVIEAATDDPLQQFPAVPSAINGRLSETGEQDRFLLAVKPGDKLRFELFAERVGSPIDAVLELLNDKGGRLAINDDAAGTTDPQLNYTVRAGVEKIIVAIKDVNGGGGRRCIYRIAVTNLNPAAVADFTLKLERDRHTVSQGDRLVMKVTADRRGYDGPIQLVFDRLPDGVQTQGDVIPAGATGVLLTLHGSGTNVAQALTSIRGESVGVEPKLVRFAADAAHPIAAMQPWLSREFGFALGQASRIGFDVQLDRLPADVSLVLGGKLQAPVRCVRPVGFDGPVRLSLVTSQAAPLTNGRSNVNRTLRQVAAVEIAADAQAVATYNAQLAAKKLLTDATTNATKVAATGTQAKAQAAAQVKAAADAKAIADKAAAATAAALKAAQVAQAAAAKALATANATAAAATKAALDADAKSKAATAAQTVAATALVNVQSKAKTTTTTADQANAQATASVKAATAKLTVAAKAAIVAATTAKNDTTYGVTVPADLKAGNYELAIRAELLSRDKKTVLARSVTTVRRLTVLNPIAVALNAAPKLTAQLDAKAGVTVTLAGKVQRRGGQQGDVTVTMSGLPKGIAIPKVVVKANQTDFQLPIKFPANFKPRSIGGVKLFGTGKMDPKGPVVRSEEVAVTINLLAPK
jgi:hypothetical protein